MSPLRTASVLAVAMSEEGPLRAQRLRPSGRLTSSGGSTRSFERQPPALIDALGIHNSTVHVYFTLSTGAGVAYTTACLTSQLD